MAKFCVNYSKKFNCCKETAALCIVVNEDNAYSLNDFIQEHSNQQILIVPTFFDEILYQEISNSIIGTNALLLYDEYGDMVQLSEETNIIVDSCNSWELFHHYIKLPFVKAIIITQELMFNLNRVRRLADAAHKQIWCYANSVREEIKQASGEEYLNAFIRPEEIDEYSKYIDMFFLQGSALDTIYKIYEKDKKWEGPLSDVINGTVPNICGNRLMNEEWSKYRLDCDRACIKGGGCRACPTQLTIAAQLQDIGFIFTGGQENERV